MKVPYPKWVYFIAYLLCGIVIISSPIVAEFITKYFNSNNSQYINEIVSKHFVKVILTTALSSVIINIPFLFINVKWRKYYIVFLSIVIYLFEVIDFLHVLLFNERANSSSFYAVIASHGNESLEFIMDYLNVKIITGFLFLVLLTLVVFHLFIKIISLRIKKIISICLGMILLFSIYVYSRNPELNILNEISVCRFYAAYTDYKAELLHFNDVHRNPPSFHVNKTDAGDETHIVIIGESTSAYHLQLYGYKRETTPELEKLKSELLILNNVRSTHVHTIASLKDVLLLRDSLNKPASYSLLELFNKAGYSTYWLSNQEFLGKNEALISAIADGANRKIYVSPLGDDKFDEALLPELDRVIAENKHRKVIFIHLMGTHLSYQERYPERFNVFKGKNISPYGEHADSFINSYDNAVLYNDYLIAEIIKRSQKLNVISSVVYFSDHGDEVYDFRDFHGHSESMLSKYMNTVPFIIYGNDKMKEKDARLTGMVKSDKPLSLQHVGITLQDLYRIESDFSDSTKSFLSVSSRNVEDSADTMSAVIPPAFPVIKDKIWVHRVNSVERLKLVEDLFRGIELDIVYQNGAFDVNHPPAVSINLSLETYFSNVNKIEDHYFWLDLKNLNAGNQREVLYALNRITKLFPVKERIIIESPEISLLTLLKKSGYHTSYYLPDLASVAEVSVTENKTKLRSKISNQLPGAVSQSINNYEMMKYYFPAYNKLVWSSLDWKKNDNHERIYNLLKEDSTIKVFLVNYDTPGWR